MRTVMSIFSPPIRCVLIAASLLHGGLTAAQGVACDPELRPIDDAAGYLARNGRCEGLYISPVSARSLELVSLLAGPMRYDLDTDPQLVVSAPDVSELGDAPLHLRAVAKSIKTYYRMDALLPRERQFVWPVREVLLPLRMTSRRLGIYGWVETARGKVFVPLRVTPQGKPSRGRPIQLTVRPAVDIENVMWRLSSHQGQRRTSTGWQTQAPQALAGEAITIVLPEGAQGLVTVEVAATVQSSGGWSKLRMQILWK